jgi:hypothetical protein
MNEQDQQKKLTDLLKQSFAPMHPEPPGDLWPKMLRRLDEGAGARPWYRALFSAGRLSSVPWFDWALLAVLVVSLCVFPRAIPIWLYHF